MGAVELRFRADNDACPILRHRFRRRRIWLIFFHQHPNLIRARPLQLLDNLTRRLGERRYRYNHEGNLGGCGSYIKRLNRYRKLNGG
jgi:hypothetical protein